MSGLRPDVDLADRLGRRRARPSSSRSKKCRSRRPASASSTATSTSSCSADIVDGSAASRSTVTCAGRIFEPLGHARHRRSCRRRRCVARIAPTEQCTPYGWPCDGTGPADAARRRARSDGAADGRRRRPRRAVQHGRAISRLFCRMLLGGGAVGTTRVLSPLDRGADDVAGDAGGRARTCAGSAGTSTRRYSSNRGELLPLGSFGHTGFTGTSHLDRSGDAACSSCSCRTACIPTARAT